MSDNDPRSTPPEQSAAAAPEVMAGIRSLHERIDELNRLIGQRVAGESRQADSWLRTHAEPPRLPAWRRTTQGEVRWPVALITAVGIALQLAVPQSLLLIRPSWIFPAVQGVLLVVLVAINPHRIDRESRLLRLLSLGLAALLSLGNGYSVARLVIDITQGTMGQDGGGQLLATGAFIWLTNVVVFSLWYWEFDRGGAVARALNRAERYPDFLFPQMSSPPEVVPKEWEPGYFDYLYLAFTNATAFSPTDVMPMSRWAKGAMLVQALISIVTVALVLSRAVNILPS